MLTRTMNNFSRNYKILKKRCRVISSKFDSSNAVSSNFVSPQLDHWQCDQIGRNFTILASLGYILLDQFSPKQAVSTHGLL